MSQWGREYKVEGIRFVPNVKTPTFKEIVPDSIVDYILLIHTGKNVEYAEDKLTELRSSFVGKPYYLWEFLVLGEERRRYG